MKLILVFVLVAAIAAFAWFLARGGQDDDTSPLPKPEDRNARVESGGGAAEARIGSPPSAAATSAGPEFGMLRTAPSAEDRPRYVEMPDGSWLPALNGVRGAPKSSWNPERPYARVVRVDRMQDADWYVHADGTWTTTRSVFRKDLGRDDPQSYALHPQPDLGEPRILGPDGAEQARR